MSRSSVVSACAVLIGAALVACPLPVLAAPQIYQYRILHPLYGDIGTYTNSVDRAGGRTEVASKLRVAVKVLGVVLFREEADRREAWRDGRLVAFHGVTTTNGDRIEVRGEARGDGFAITTAAGTVMAPADIHPSNPWSARILGTDVMMSSKTGEVFKVRVSGGAQAAGFHGNAERLRRYEIDSDTRQFVWLDDHDVPVAFRTKEDGAAIDFLLVRYPSGAPVAWSTPQRRKAPPRDEDIAADTMRAH